MRPKKRMHYYWSLMGLGMIFTSPALHAEANSLIQDFPKEFMVNEVISINPIAGHHFNVDAPKKCGDFGFLETNPEEYKCQVTKPGEYDLVAGVCDDLKSFCRIEKFKITVKSDGEPRGLWEKIKSFFLTKMTQEATEESRFHQRREVSTPPGFLPGFSKAEIEKALKRTKEKNALLLLDFSAIWCPSCNDLEEFVFWDPEFTKMTSDLVKLKLDVDSEASFELKSRFQVGGYPTVVLATSDLKEVSRLVGFYPKPLFLKWLEKEKRLKSIPVESLIGDQEALKKEENRLRLASWYFERSEYEKVKELLGIHSSKKTQRLLLLSELKTSKGSDLKKKRIQILKTLITEFESDFEFPEWVLSLSSESEEAAKPFLKKAVSKVNASIQNGAYEESGLTLSEILVEGAELSEALGDKSHARDFYSRCADELAKRSQKSPLALARGSNLDRGYCLYKAGRNKESVELFKKLVNTYPEEFTFHFYFSRALTNMGDLQSALPHAKKALEKAYGDNYLRSVQNLASLYVGLNQKEEAKELLKAALSSTQVSHADRVRSHRYLADLEKLNSGLK